LRPISLKGYGCRSTVFIPSLLFFFSSRRRHTRSKRDWSSDVCSSDLDHAEFSLVDEKRDVICRRDAVFTHLVIFTHVVEFHKMRSEERRVGKECRSGQGADECKKKRNE